MGTDSPGLLVRGGVGGCSKDADWNSGRSDVISVAFKIRTESMSDTEGRMNLNEPRFLKILGSKLLLLLSVKQTSVGSYQRELTTVLWIRTNLD
jgi:hypothetical protein